MAAQGITAAQDITGLHEASLGLMAAQDITRLHGGTGHHEASWRHRASRGFMAAQILVARAILVTALVADLVARFSSNSYVFL